MIARHFTKSDIASVQKWLIRHGKHELKTEQPKIGFIVPGVAAAFLLQCEGNIGIMDSLITNPLCSSETRHKALNSIYDNIIGTCHQLGIERIIGFTTDEGTLKRSLAYGFIQKPHTLLTRG